MSETPKPPWGDIVEIIDIAVFLYSYLNYQEICYSTYNSAVMN